MGTKSRLKWERRYRDGWHPLIGSLGAYYRALATGVPMESPNPLIQDPTATDGDHPKGGHDEAVGRGESPMPADPTPAPEWAVKMLVGAYNAPPGTWRLFTHDPLARLIASVRDAALREAAEQMPGLTLNEAMHPYDAAWAAASTFKENILALVGTAPKEAPRG